MSRTFEDLADIVCLVYHEARNIRHPIKGPKLTQQEASRYRTEYKKLISLPKGRDDAWSQMAAVRLRASNAKTAEKVVNEFARTYDISLESLYELYQQPIWKHSSAYGGHKWIQICAEAINLVASVASGDEQKAESLFVQIAQMNHNTGNVGKKLKALKEVEAKLTG